MIKEYDEQKNIEFINIHKYQNIGNNMVNI